MGTLYDNINWIKTKDYIIFHYGDVIFDTSITKLVDSMINSKHSANMVVDIRNNAQDVGIVKFNSKKILLDF